jgi:RimJ/RimL family protein N-acetyltransferase
VKYLLDKVESPRIFFRTIQQTDYDGWLPFFKDPLSFQYWVGELESPEIECTKWYDKQFHRYANQLGGMNALIEKATGKLIGHAGLLVQRVDEKEELEVGYSLLSSFRNKGFATEAAQRCKSAAFENNWSTSLISIISITNTPSANVATKNGMVLDKQTIYNQNHVSIFRISKEKAPKSLNYSI